MTGVLELTMTDDLAALRPLAGGQRLDDVTVRALDLVIDANGDLDVWFAIGTGALEGRLTSVQRFARRAGVELVASHRVTDGLVAVPAAEAVELCRAFSRREPLTVVNHLVAEEHRIDQGESAPGGDRVARRARALVRTWTRGA
jgi:hypothetical protein